MTIYTNAAGVNPAMFHVWGPFYIISVFPIILHLSFGDKLSQNREFIWLSLFSLKVMENSPFHLRKQSIALSDSLIKSALSIYFIFHTQEASLPFPKVLWFESLSYMFQIFSACLLLCCCCLFYIWGEGGRLVVGFCCFLGGFLEFWILKLLNTWSLL